MLNPNPAGTDKNKRGRISARVLGVKSLVHPGGNPPKIGTLAGSGGGGGGLTIKWDRGGKGAGWSSIRRPSEK